jgi:diaminopimelate epimerase
MTTVDCFTFMYNTIPFIKMHGLGNDFIIIDERYHSYDLTPALILHMSDRHRGIGCDQFIILRESGKADILMLIANCDGSWAEACGNATRCIAGLIASEQNKNKITIETVAGILVATVEENGLITIAMGRTTFDWQKIPLSHECDPFNLPINIDGLQPLGALNIGNPHILFMVPDITQVDLQNIGPQIENHSLFPLRINVNIAQIINKQQIKLRVFERGVGETLACGSGACATVGIAYKLSLVDATCRVSLPGGDLTIHVRRDEQIFMTGPYAMCFTGVYNIER